jgi:hypothetical protein
MASSIKVTDTNNWTAPFLRYMPTSAGVNSEPVVSNANFIFQTILSPPFAWRWNRNTATFTTTSGTQDYSSAIADFGFLEKATVTDGSGNVFELEEESLISEIGAVNELARPSFICLFKDDNAGNITFRFGPVPDATYTVKLTYQKKPALITAAAFNGATATWTPIPDEYSFIYQNGLMALNMAGTSDDPRWQIFWSRFVSSLIGVSEGLTAEDKLLFLNNMIDFSRQLTSASIGVQQGKQAKAS